MKEARHIHAAYAPRHFASRGEWETYASWLRRHARVSLCLLPEPPKTPLHANVFGRWEGDGYTCEKVFFESLPGFYVTGNLFRPSSFAEATEDQARRSLGEGGPTSRKRKRVPAILCPHGHWPDGRLHDRDPRGSVVARCIQLARMGAVVFSYDMVGHNDSCQVPHRELPADPHWGLSLMALQTLNSVRSLDFVLSLPEVDPRRIGATGASGGGTQTFTLMAVEDRLAAAAPICMISYSMQGGCLCENQPLLRIDGTSVDLARLFAPKPTFMGSCTGDWTKDTPKKEHPAVREIYCLYGEAGRLAHLHVDDGHNYNRRMREAVYGFFNKWLFGARTAKPVRETEVRRPPFRDRMLWWGRPTPPPMPFEELKTRWRSRAEAALKPHLKSPAAARKGLGPLLPHALGVTLSSVDEFRKSKPEGIRVRSVGDELTVTPGPAAKNRAAGVQFFSAYNRVPFADRVHEVLAAIEDVGGRAKLVGKGEAGVWCLYAAALSERVKEVQVDLGRFDPNSDAAWRRRLDVPAIRQVGGLAAAFAMVGRRPLQVKTENAAIKRLVNRYAR